VVKPTGEVPEYGGTLNLVLGGDIRNFDAAQAVGQNNNISALVNTSLWLGDWALGTAGGHGSAKTDWRGQYDIWENKVPNIAESWKWQYDENKHQGTVVLVTHRVVTKVLICALLGLDDSHFWNIEQSTCGITTFNYRNGQFILTEHNNTSFLKPLSQKKLADF